MNRIKYQKSQFKGKIEQAVRQLSALRSDPENPVDASFGEFIQEKFNISLDNFFADLGIDPTFTTISNIVALPDLDVRWIIPELIREAIYLGIRRGPIYPSLIASEEQINGLSAVMPHINMSDATPRRVGEAETIPLGAISYGSKTFTLYKVGRGIKLSYEVIQYASLNVVSIFLRDFGVKMGQGMDVLAIECLINGEQPGGTEAAPVIGVGTVGTKEYRDFLRPWIRMARLGRRPSIVIGGETAALDTLDLDEFKKRATDKSDALLVLKTPVPATTNYYIHGNVPNDQEIILDPSSSIIKFNAQPLLVESEKIVSNQTQAFYASATTGFAKAFRDSAIILDSSLDFAVDGFPTWMDVDAAENVIIE